MPKDFFLPPPALINLFSSLADDYKYILIHYSFGDSIYIIGHYNFTLISILERSIKQLTGLGFCQCRLRIIQKNHIACAIERVELYIIVFYSSFPKGRLQ